MKNQWKKTFQDKLSDYQKSETNLSWSIIESQVKARKKKKILAFWMTSLSAAAAIAIFFVLNLNIFGTKNAGQEDVIAQNTTSKPVEVIINKTQTNDDIILEKNNEDLIQSEPLYATNLQPKKKDIETDGLENVENITHTHTETFSETDSHISNVTIDDSIEEKPIEIKKIQTQTEEFESQKNESAPISLYDELEIEDFGTNQNNIKIRTRLGIFSGAGLNSGNNNSQNTPMLASAPVLDDLRLGVTSTDIQPMTSRILSTPKDAVKTYEKHYRNYKYGLSFNLGLTENLSFGTGLYVSSLKSKFGYSYHNNSGYNTTQTLNYIGIPMNVYYKIFSFRPFSIYATGGGMVEYMVHGKNVTTQKSDGSEKRESIHEHPFQLSANCGVGLNLGITKGLNFYAEPGVSYYFNDGSKLESYYSSKKLLFNLNLGFRIDI